MKSNSVWLIVLTMLRAVPALLMLAGAAQAANLNFNGGAVAGCTYSSGAYSCNNIASLGSTDSIIIASGYTVVVNTNIALGFAQGLQMSGSAKLQTSGSNAIDLSGSQSLNVTGGTLAAGGNFKLGASAQSITANVSAATVTTGGASTYINGTVTATGAISLGSSSTITGAVSGASLGSGSGSSLGPLTVTGAVSLGSSNTINGALSAASISTSSSVTVNGAVSISGLADLGSGIKINGNISGATITTDSPATITGSVTAATSFTLASGSTVTGNITAPTVTLSASGSTVKGNIAASSSLDIGSGSTVNGNLSGGGLVLRASSVVVNGNATFTGDVDIGSGNTINGDLTARNVNTRATGATINGNAAVNSIYLDWGASVSKTITCTGAAPGAPVCSCVTKADSNYKPTCGAAPPTGPHHIQINHSGTALTCQPQTVTLTACANASCTAPHSSASTTVTLQPGGKQFTITGGVNSAATVERATEGTAVLSSSSHAYTCVNSGNAAQPCDMIFKKSGLTVSAPNHVSMVPATLTIQALTASANNQSCVPLVAGKTVSVDMGCAYNNPSSGTVSPKVGSTSLACGSTTAVQMSFNASGTATPALEYADAGKIDLTASYSATGGGTAFNAVGSASFITAPEKFRIVATNAVTGIKTPAPPPGIFAKASEPFRVEISAVNAQGEVTKNFGLETVKEIPTFLQPAVANGAEGNNGIIVSGQLKQVSAGTFTGADGSAGNWNFSDVGAIKLEARLANTSSYYQGYNNSGFQTKGELIIARFVPDHFDTVLMTNAQIDAMTPVPPLGRSMDCTGMLDGVKPCAGASNSFVYSGQPFFMKVLAYNGASPTPALTLNYAGTLAKAITISAWTAAGGELPPTGGVLGWSGADPKFAFTAGTGILAAPIAKPPDVLKANLPSFTFSKAYPESDIPPATIYLRADDADKVSSLRSVKSSSVEAPLTVVSGRLLVANAYGSQNSPLPIDASAQYYMPSGYVFNPKLNAVSGTTVDNQIKFDKCLKALDTSGNGGETCPGKPTLTVANTNDVLTLANGKGKFRVAAPTPTLTGIGSVRISLGSLFDYLPSTFGRATFGVYRSGPVIYTREVHN